ncbi:hypothetical protein FBUS_04312 [Fasciolopsis buskii]|uniref:E3 ubiquitin-protein ligase CHFR cysteine rich domain-containing protein n=1 Tax=Fasciolopsis buskii TaxID=27845 RepID=A0A8E0S1W8_9TREM|nr:hypothetical protein FBUS_04312 [Fasciolopsis buski]
MSGDVWGIVRVRPNEGQTQEVREFSLRSDLCYIGSAEGPGHSVCACCSCPVPIFVQHQSTANLVQCEICCRFFCALINSGGCPGCSGTCLTHLTDLRNIALPSDILLRNTVETSILKVSMV